MTLFSIFVVYSIQWLMFMKNIFITLYVLMCINITLHAQQYVSTTPSNRNVIIEEFSGISCSWCPEGQRVANEICDANPDRVWAVNIHAGSLSPTAYPNLQCPDGIAIHDFFSPSSYPSGVVNRQSDNAFTWYFWEEDTNSQLSELSEVNIGGEVSIDYGTRTATIVVEVYYTADSPESTNYLTVAMLQDSILGPQSGSYHNPAQVIGDQYCHMHILRDIVNGEGTLGDPITATTQGSLTTKTYIYEIPENIGNPNGVDVGLDHIHFLAWVAKDNRYILSANALTQHSIGSPSLSVSSITPEEIVNGEDTALTLVISNTGNEDTVGDTEIVISSDDEHLSIVDGTATCGIIHAGENITIDEAFIVRADESTPHQHQFTININITNNGNSWNSQRIIHSITPCRAPDNLSASTDANNITLSWDASPTAIAYNIYRDNDIIAENVDDTTYVDQGLSHGTYCYTARSICADDESEDSNIVCQTITPTTIQETSSIAHILPNPTTGMIKIESQEIITKVEIYDIIGNLCQQEFSHNTTLEININGLPTGVYLVNIITTEHTEIVRIAKE